MGTSTCNEQLVFQMSIQKYPHPFAFDSLLNGSKSYWEGMLP